MKWLTFNSKSHHSYTNISLKRTISELIHVPHYTSPLQHI